MNLWLWPPGENTIRGERIDSTDSLLKKAASPRYSQARSSLPRSPAASGVSAFLGLPPPKTLRDRGPSIRSDRWLRFTSLFVGRSTGRIATRRCSHRGDTPIRARTYRRYGSPVYTLPDTFPAKGSCKAFARSGRSRAGRLWRSKFPSPGHKHRTVVASAQPIMVL